MLNTIAILPHICYDTKSIIFADLQSVGCVYMCLFTSECDYLHFTSLGYLNVSFTYQFQCLNIKRRTVHFWNRNSNSVFFLISSIYQWHKSFSDIKMTIISFIEILSETRYGPTISS